MPSRRSSSSLNPFDSDDDAGSSPAKSAFRAYGNPFDDDAAAATGPATASTGRQRDDHRSLASSQRKETRVLDAKNPFDDDEDDNFGFAARNPRHGASAKEERGEEHGARAKSTRHQFKERVSATGDAALKTARKIKDAGANQASKVIEGGMNQAQRIKESSHNAFKANGHSNGNRNLKPSGGSGDLTENKAWLQGRDELLSSESAMKASSARTRYDDSQFRTQDLEYRSTEELEGYALQKSEETGNKLQNCLRVAEDIRGDATKTLVTLHEQGEQIRRTHEVAVDIDQNLTTGEKLLGSLGGMFSRTWKPKKSRPVMGPAVGRSDSFKRRGHHLEQRGALGLNRSNSKGRNTHASAPNVVPETTQAKLEMDKTKQDDALSDLSNLLEQIKGMSIDMGFEISRQNQALEDFQDDVVILDGRVKGANLRGRHLLKK